MRLFAGEGYEGVMVARIVLYPHGCKIAQTSGLSLEQVSSLAQEQLLIFTETTVLAPDTEELPLSAQ
ncbi:hypothetical protein GNE08_01135 [Trichormus variabilis ARAD]|uniref:Uncharacterized protein n=1 Tax=Trichormus variabilis N2B TaxID=2681315 RepID=A0ABR6S506_ANAVA|nr:MULTISPECIES: hypothetical protein [Nostocaceae]MBC1212823.1 hypothetical protein [Trichormus variabilis ARAD]MBC1257286.1 hypothetical protein [Trichormus variabilis V5]MBC1270141.1 hypothetical protein [Trichormus variabilis FSR]MBC1301475.1 hypothetical protein [Trichormus variabilis N2B]MBC1313814.1 hypothetical protein [Trichormus variabilis PNB]